MAYPFHTIRINDREITLQAIIQGEAIAHSPFEENTFGFIREWFLEKGEFFLQTSGSTGPPKKIILTRSQMEASARATATALALRKGSTALVCLDTQYIAGMMMLVRSIVCGMRIIAQQPVSNPLHFFPNDPAIDFAALVPYQLDTIIASPDRKKLNSIRTVIIGGAAISSETIHQLQAFSAEIYATYGMTETLSHIALRKLNGGSPDACFHTLPGIAISADERACLKINADYLPNEVVTNDLVNIINPASFQWLGRVDNVINTGGVKVSPESLESKLELLKQRLNLHHPIFISSKPDDILGEKIVCVIGVPVLSERLANEFREYFRQNLGKYETPKEIIALFPLPETPTGKIDRKAIKKVLSDQL